ncbi:putative 3'(2'),5'-bisphosphate nucleotidase, mitochondrial isoform X2 [Aristolochia californica]|uniref:putative 3'(2'),5'-bisphosphate nucleotidase, mitochondrial isoform X2 n=1 Tax=Aristolochia californica TaxID=171875 RepID=UPI0035DB566C
MQKFKFVLSRLLHKIVELGRAFPSIPLVAEEDSAFLRSSLENSEKEKLSSSNFLVDSVFDAVSDKASAIGESLSHNDVLDAIDRGGKITVGFGTKPATYWVLDPIDGTRGFLKGSDALYVVGLALVVEGNIVVGVMGCPNWKECVPTGDVLGDETGGSGSGIIMIAHTRCGTWAKRLPTMLDDTAYLLNKWSKCSVDSCSLVHEAGFCIPESQTWESLPLSTSFATTDADNVGDKQKVLLLPACCGSLCKYLMVAFGRASVFIVRARSTTVIKAWDHAVGMICVHEAGGQVTDWKGSPLDLAADEVGRRVIFPSGGVLVTNGNLHIQILQMISTSLQMV